MPGSAATSRRPGRLDDEAVERALKALARFRVLCRTIGVADIHVLATAAARDASNGEAFLQQAADACGCAVELLSGAREAELSALGVISGSYQPDGIVGDLGGGSLELVDVAGDDVGRGITLRLGGLALQDLSEQLAEEGAPDRARGARARRSAAEPARAAPSTPSAAPGARSPACTRPTRGYPLHVMHGYAIDPEEGLRFLELVEEAEAASSEGDRSRLRGPPAAPRLRRHRAGGNHPRRASGRDLRLGARRARGAPLRDADAEGARRSTR